MRPLTRSCFLLLVLGRLLLLALPFLLGICLPSPWTPPFPLHAVALIPLSLAKVRLSPTLTLSLPHDLVLWTDGSVSFPFGKGGSGVLANCYLCGTEATLSFLACPVCSSFSTEACAILQALCWSRQHQQVCHFSSLLLLSDSCSVLATLSFPPSFLLSQTLWQIWHELSSLSSCSIRLQRVPGHSFLSENDAADELARRGALLAPSAIPCSLSPLVSRIHSRLISDWRRTVSSKFLVSQVPSISTDELVLPRHARYVLSRLRCNGHSLLLDSYLFRIGRIKNPSCSTCGHLSSHSALSSYGLFAPLTLWRLSVSLRPLVQTLGSFPASGTPWSSVLGKGQVNNNRSFQVVGAQYSRLCKAIWPPVNGAFTYRRRLTVHPHTALQARPHDMLIRGDSRRLGKNGFTSPRPIREDSSPWDRTSGQKRSAKS